MSRLLRRWPWLLLPLLLGADCPGDDSVDRWLDVDVITAGVIGDVRPPSQSQRVKVRFRRETASRDLSLDAGVSIAGQVLSPSESASVDPGAPATFPTSALIHGRSLSSERQFTVVALGGAFADDTVVPGSYELQVIPDESVSRYGILYQRVEIPGADLSSLELDWGYQLSARITEYDLFDNDHVALPDMVIEAFTEIEPGQLRRAGPRAVTNDNGVFTLYLAEGSYTLRIASLSEPGVAPYPTALQTGFEVPADIDRLHEQAAEDGEPIPTLFTYPNFERHSLSGRLVTAGPFSTGVEGNAEVSVWGVVHRPPQYVGLDEVDFEVGALLQRAFSNEGGDFSFGQGDAALPAAVYSLDVVPGYYSDASSRRLTGDQAIDLQQTDQQLGDVSLSSRVDLALRVLDGQDRLVDGARIEVRDLGLSGYVQAQTTDETGTAVFTLAQGPHDVVVVPPDDRNLARERFEIEMASSDRVAVVRLATGIYLSGQVAVGDDLLRGARLRFTDPADGALLGEAETRRGGTYELQIPRAWVWPEIEDVEGDDDDSAE